MQTDQITERDTGNSGTMCPVHCQLLVPVTYRGLWIWCDCLRKSTKVENKSSFLRHRESLCSDYVLLQLQSVQISEDCLLFTKHQQYQGLQQLHWLLSWFLFHGIQLFKKFDMAMWERMLFNDWCYEHASRKLLEQ